MLPPDVIGSVAATFAASVRSVGTAVTLAAVGVYLHRRRIVEGDGKRTLALLSQQVTFPLFLFTKIVYCNQDWSRKACPNITSRIADVWFLLLWPLVVVGLGLVVGSLIVRAAGTPRHQARACLAAVAFGNSSGLPITLLTVIHSNFPSTSDLGRVDPTLFLSIYLLVYPLLQWSLGGWLLAPPEEEYDEQQQATTIELDAHMSENTPPRLPSPRQFGARRSSGGSTSYGRSHSISDTISQTLRHNVLNYQNQPGAGQDHMKSLDESNYISDLDLAQLGRGNGLDEDNLQTFTSSLHQRFAEGSVLSPILKSPLQRQTHGSPEPENGHDISGNHEQRRLLEGADTKLKTYTAERNVELTTAATPSFDADSVLAMIRTICARSFQPPVIGSLAGIFVATIQPLRGIFVDLETRSSRAALQWLFDGLYAVGLSAVPINMMILGCNISAGCSADRRWGAHERHKAGLLCWRTMVWIVLGKMVVLPAVGIGLCYCLKNYFWTLPDDIDGAVYLVMMIVFLTPTANNVMVIVELGTGAKEGIAQVIALQYFVAPLLLSLTMTVAIGVASDWS